MSKLDELIKELCPDGVEFKKLGEICEIRSGWGFPNIEQGKTNGNFPFYKVGDMNSHGNEFIMTVANNYVDLETVIRLGCKPAPKGTVIFPKIGAAIGTNKKRILAQEACFDNNIVGLIPSTKVLSRYLYYQIESVDLMNFTDYSGAMPSIRKTTLEKFELPLPPLPVQSEIVRILDNFTELTAELTAELTVRKKQYEYYRENLLFHYYNPNFESMTLGDVCYSVSSGKNSNRDEEGFYPVYGSTGIIARTDYPVYNKTQILVARVGANAGYVHIASGQYDVSDNTLILDIKDKMNLRYVYYLLSSFNLHRFAKGGGQPLVTAGQIKLVTIPVPPIEEQNRIVDILDRFDALCTDISAGLPAEIEARKKQYEYYRDKLLTFSACPVDAKEADA